jgi:hypothetical protein
MMYTNLVSAIVLVPATVLLGTRYGAPGAASVWVALNASYVLVTLPLMHRHLLVGEKWRWYLHDVMIPLVSVGIVGLIARMALPLSMSRLATFCYVAAAGIAMATVALAATPRARAVVFQMIRSSRIPSVSNAAIGGRASR